MLQKAVGEGLPYCQSVEANTAPVARELAPVTARQASKVDGLKPNRLWELACLRSASVVNGAPKIKSQIKSQSQSQSQSFGFGQRR